MTTISPCPCNPNISYLHCCEHYHSGALANTAQTLMRARYSAFVKHNIEFIKASTLPAQQTQLDLESIAQWSMESDWLGLEVINETLAADQRHATVEFIAHWQDAQGRHQHQETSLFIKPAEQWYFYDPNVALSAKRNAACPCLSGLKFKKCCAPYL
ncbi:MAG TPA: YchJ family protein [Thiopseudomonas sp.]|nr:YchJ family protein [Thiopseudomonas sp.]